MIICDQQQCTGCAVCTTACKHRAISLQEGVNGHLFPVIDSEKCVECGACARLCPNNSAIQYNTPAAAYIATVKNPLESKESTSAGVASALARQIIKDGGVVYGCCGRDIEHVRHIRVDSDKEVDLLKGSKYVQSTLTDILSSIREDISKGKTVLFIGTPCQVAGVTRYLHNPDNLVTIDLVCHGVPSQSLLIDALHSYLPNFDLSSADVMFRKKKDGRSRYGLFVKDEYGTELYNSTFPTNEYITGFLSGLYYRESCYQCHYARPERVSDISLGDYWDFEGKINIDNKEGGLSMLIENTEKGASLIKESKNILSLLSGDYSGFVTRNGQLSHPIKKNERYEDFKTDYPRLGFHKAAKKHLRMQKLMIRRNMLANKIKDLIHACSAGIGGRK